MDKKNKKVKKAKIEIYEPVRKEENKSKKKNNSFQILVISIILILVFYIAINSILSLVNKKSDTYMVKYGKVSKDETLSGLIIRDEKIISFPEGTNNDAVSPIIDEGKKIAKGENIFKYYTKDETDINKQISDINLQIQTEINKLDEPLSSVDTKIYDSQLETILEQISTPNDLQSIKEYKKKLDEIMSKKETELGKISSKDSEIKKLVDKKNSLLTQKDSDSKFVTSEKSGIISYRIDGLEDKITTDNLSIYNKEYIQDLKLNNGHIISSVDNSGKIVNNFTCYIACTSKSTEAKNAKLKQKAYIEIPNGNIIDAKIVQINDNSDSSKTIIFEIDQDIDSLLIYRKTNFDIIWWNDSGFKIPNSAIIEQNGLQYVIKIRNNYKTKVLVKVKNKSDYYSIVNNYSTSEIKELDNVDDNAEKSIVLYDEIVTNPTEQDIATISK